MTESYEWNPMPHCLAVVCPDCGSEAKFELAEIRRINLRKDVEYFKKSKDFEFARTTDYGGGFCNVAIYFHGLKQSALSALQDLPEGYEPGDWEHSPYLYRTPGHDLGTIVCNSCHMRRKHVLNWPDDAYFKIDHKNGVLWAFDREYASELLRYIRSEDRDRGKFRHRASLMKVPTKFLTAKVRESVARALDRILSA